MTNLGHFKNKKNDLAHSQSKDSPFFALQHRMNRMFDDFFRGFDIEPFGIAMAEPKFMPQLNITEDQKEIVVSAELPGLEEKDIDVTLTKDMLVIKGEKRSDTEDEGKDYHRVECSYGSFERTIALPKGIDENKAVAELKKGVLKITIPKTEQAVEQKRKLEIKGQ